MTTYSQHRLAHGIGMIVFFVSPLTTSMIGTSESLQGVGVYLLDPTQENGEQRSSNTGSNRTRRPVGNST